MIVVDKAGHLASDDLTELHRFAELIGLKRCWFQGSRKRHPHYDLTTQQKIEKAILHGAKLVTSKELIKITNRGLK